MRHVIPSVSLIQSPILKTNKKTPNNKTTKNDPGVAVCPIISALRSRGERATHRRPPVQSKFKTTLGSKPTTPNNML